MPHIPSPEDMEKMQSMYHRIETPLRNGRATRVIMYGLGELGVSQQLRDGVVTGEMYLHRQKPISRKNYEELRQAYPELPAAGPPSVDLKAKLRATRKAEMAKSKAEAMQVVADPAIAAEHDRKMTGRIAEGIAIEELDGTIFLGERDASTSRRILASLRKCGCTGIHLLRVDPVEKGFTASAMVLRLPTDKTQRVLAATILQRLGADEGIPEMMPDHGQQFGFAKLG